MWKILLTTEAATRNVLYRKVFLEILRNSQENTLVRVSFLIKLQASVCDFIKNKTLAQVFFCEFCEVSKNTFFTEHLWLLLYWNLGITKPCTHLHPAPSTSTQLISTSTQFHPPPPSSFQPPPSSLQHPQQYLKQYIARNWAISPNLGRKIKCCPFWLKIGTHGISEVLIPSPDLDFWNSDPKIHV